MLYTLQTPDAPVTTNKTVMRFQLLVKFLLMFFHLPNKNVKFNQMKKRGWVPVSEACKQHLCMSKVVSSPT